MADGNCVGRPTAVLVLRTSPLFVRNLRAQRVYLYEQGQLGCELCRALRRDEPQASDIVRHSEHGHTVRLTVRVA